MADATKTSGRGRASWPTAAKPLGREASRAAQREKILRATIEVVAKRGYADTSVERICEQAGVSFPTWRKSFSDRQECFLAAFDHSVDEGRAAVEGAVEGIEGTRGWAERVGAALAAALEFIAEDPARARLCLVESLTAGAEGIDRYEAAARLGAPGLGAGRLQRGGKKAELAPVLEETVLGGVAWVLHQKVAAGEARKAVKLYPGLLEALLAPYLGARKARTFVERAAPPS